MDAKWLFRIGKYEEIVSREELAAKALLRAYGSKMTLAELMIHER